MTATAGTVRLRTEDEILADPETTPSMKKRIEADRYGRALMDGLRRHHKKLGLVQSMPPKWDDMSSVTRGHYWRPAIYDMLEKMGGGDATEKGNL